MKAELKLDFPTDFVWGVATSAYQIEGAWNEDGRTPSIWDHYCRIPGAIANGDSGDIACDHYHRYPEDIALMRELGIKAYRLSISWSRIFPSPEQRPNSKGLAFYQRLVEALLTAGITPWITLYHYDLPLWLHELGGWTNKRILDEFEIYSQTVVKALGGMVKNWFIINEPRPIAWLGYGQGIHAPGQKDYEAFLKAAWHLQLAVGRAIQAMRSLYKDLVIGTVLDLTAFQPLTSSAEDCAACERFDQFYNRFYLDPTLKGEYPPITASLGFEPDVQELKQNFQKLDFIGINYYFRQVVAADQMASLLQGRIIPETSHLTEMGWKIYPQGLEKLLLRLKTEYSNIPVYITENGAAFQDLVCQDGVVQDDDRIAFLRDHLVSAHRALQEGVNLKGYFVWSLLDNFEWSRGYSKRFGLISVDFQTQKRTPKKSFYWYQEIIAANALRLP